MELVGSVAQWRPRGLGFNLISTFHRGVAYVYDIILPLRPPSKIRGRFQWVPLMKISNGLMSIL